MKKFKYFDKAQAKTLVTHLEKITVGDWVKAEHLAQICNINESQKTNWSKVRMLAKQITLKFGIPIVSGNNGFKIALNQEDVDQYIRSLYSTIKGLRERIDMVKIAFDIYNRGHIKSFSDLIDTSKPKRIKLKMKGGDSNKSIFLGE